MMYGGWWGKRDRLFTNVVIPAYTIIAYGSVEQLLQSQPN
jgi:hypothetical protein